MKEQQVKVFKYFTCARPVCAANNRLSPAQAGARTFFVSLANRRFYVHLLG
jgi:hypothetical protein